MEIIQAPYMFQYCLNPESDEPILELNGQIGQEPDGGQGVNGFIFAKEMAILDEMGKNKISIFINSDGGDVKQGYTIFTTILRSKTPIWGYIGGFCLSIAGVIFQACDKRIIYPYGTLMMHNPAIKGEDVTVEESDFLDWIKSTLIVMLGASTKLSNKNISMLMENETWMDAQTSVDKGFADEVAQMKEKVEAPDLEYIQNNKFEIRNYSNEYNLVMNKLIDNLKNKELTMIEKLKRVLNLADSATEEEVINESKKVFPFVFDVKNGYMKEEDCATNEVAPNTAGTAPGNDALLPTKLLNDDDDMDEDEVMDLKNLKLENAKLKEKIASFENQKVIDLIDNSIKLGKIKSSESKHWIEIAKSNYNSAETILNSMNINKQSNSLRNEINSKENKEKTAKLYKDTINGVENIIDEVVNESKMGDVFNKDETLPFKFDFNKLFNKIK